MGRKVSARNKHGKFLHPGGKYWFSPKLLPWLRKRPAGVDNRTIKYQKQPLRLRALHAARRDLGVKEQGGNNTGPVVDQIILENGGVIGEPWCGDAVARWYRKAGSKAVQRGWAAVVNLGRLPGMRKLPDVRAGRPGDILVFDFPGGSSDGDHTGLLERYSDSEGRKRSNKSATHVQTIEGNTTSGAAVSDGFAGDDGVSRQIRPISQVKRVVRVDR